MKLLSINVGLPQEIDWRAKTVRTSIFKAPIAGRVRVTTLNVEGDRQSDLSVHGGSDKEIGRAHGLQSQSNLVCRLLLEKKKKTASGGVAGHRRHEERVAERPDRAGGAAED